MYNYLFNSKKMLYIFIFSDDNTKNDVMILNYHLVVESRDSMASTFNLYKKGMSEK